MSQWMAVGRFSTGTVIKSNAWIRCGGNIVIKCVVLVFLDDFIRCLKSFTMKGVFSHQGRLRLIAKNTPSKSCHRFADYK